MSELVGLAWAFCLQDQIVGRVTMYQPDIDGFSLILREVRRLLTEMMSEG